MKANLAADAIKAGLGVIINLVKEVGSAVKDYISKGSDMAKTAAENHAKLTQVMRNTMDASDEEIASITELTKAQEGLGVVSASVQTAGAQELGTYLEKSDTLKTLIPVMNDMIVQQNGINASQESAANIATMLGKVMNGQVGALSRYGYTFDEIQENILKYGTEAERAAVLAEVVGESVGGMNEALAQTNEGKMAALATVMDNTKIKVGEMANDFQAQIMGRMLPSIDSLSGAFLGVLSGEGSVDDMAAAFSGVFDEIESIINDFLPMLLDLGVQLITAVVTGIAENIDVIAETAMNLIQTLVETISELLPVIIEAGLQLLLGLVDGIIQALPSLVEAAMEAVVTLANGLADALPELIPVIIETIIFIVDTLLDNLDALLDAALAIIMGLADGLIEALPVLIEALPKIIESIINFIINSLPKLIEMGVELVVKLAFGLIQAIPQLLAAIPQIIGALIQGIIDLFPKIIESGINIVKSLWNGIKGTGQWLADNFMDMIAGIVNSIVGAVNKVLGLIGVELPTMQVKAKVDTAPVNMGVNSDSIKRTQSAVAEAAQDAVKQTDYANAAILQSAKDAAEERIAVEKSVTKGKSAEAKEQEKAAKELAKEEEKAAKELAKEKERIAKENADAINKLGSDLTKALKEQYSEQKAAYLEAINDEVEAVKSASYEKMRQYDIEYAEKMKLLDEEESYRLKAIQAYLPFIHRAIWNDRVTADVVKAFAVNFFGVKKRP